MHAEERRNEESFVLGGYAILETIGTGGMGVVYRARDVHLGREVALKVLRDDLRNNAHVVARFRREAEAFARLNHPNIVRIYAVGVVGKIPFIAMELIDGEPLNQRLVRCGPMEWKDALDIGLQLVDGLAAAHEHGVIHRDIKPGNILLGRNGRVYLTDFGIAKVLGAATQLTVDGARLGTPQYLCPERCRNEEITPLSDLYSLGVVLFQVMSGRLPFEAENSVDLIRKIAGEVPERLQTYVPGIPDAVDRFIAHLLDPNPAQRPKDARALRALLARVRGGEALDANIDERVSGLRALRETLPAVVTPRPAMPSQKQSTKLRLKRTWYKLPRSVRRATPILGILALGAAGAMAYPSWDRGTLQGIPAPTVEAVTAAWSVPGSLLRYQAETDTVGCLVMAVNDIQVKALLPVTGGQDVLLVVAGMPGSPMAGQQGVWRYSPATQATSVVVPMLPAAGSAAFTVLAAWVDERTQEDALFVSTSEGAWLLNGSFAARSRFAPQAVSLGSATADSAHLLMQAPAANELRLVDLATPGLPGRSVPIENNKLQASSIAPDSRVCTVQFQPGRSAVSTVQLQRLTPPLESRTLSAQVLSMPSNAFDAAASHVLLGVAGEDGPHAQIFDVETGSLLRDLGAGEQPQWVPGQDRVLVLGADYAGRTQVWSLPLQPDQVKEQRTYVGAGVGKSIAVTADGKFAVLAQGADNRLIVVQL